MQNLVNQVLSGARMSEDGGFATNRAGLELLQQGCLYVDEACDCLVKKVASCAKDIASVAALTRRFPGVDYLLQYLLQEGMRTQPSRVLGIIETFPPSLLAQTLNVAARMLSASAGASAEGMRNCSSFLAFAAQSLDSPIPEVQKAAERVAKNARGSPSGHS